jgi:pyruvate/2-oxoglutarate dehydrogenase complex dihydrolipoamide acyltransferase (E2) component
VESKSKTFPVRKQNCGLPPWFFVFAVIAYFIVTDNSVATAVNFITKLVGIWFEKKKWWLLHNPRNPVVKYLMWRRALKLAKELEAKKTALQAQGKTVAPNVPARQAQPQAQPQQPAQPPAQARPQPTAQQPQTQYTDDQKIQIFMRANPKASREQAIAALKRAGKI